MDGVLIDSEQYWFRVEQLLFDKYNIEGNASSIRDKLMGLSDNESIKILKKEFGIPASIEEIRDFRCKALINIYKKELELRKGAQGLLSYIKLNDIPCALATSSPPVVVDFVLENTGIRDFFQSIITINKVLNGKPAPDMFLKAAEELSVNHADCLVFEDAPNGIKAAKAAGMYVLGVLHSFNSAEELNGADQIVSELDEIDLDKVLK